MRGWYGNRQQHALASKGVKSKTKAPTMAQRRKMVLEAKKRGRIDPESIYYDPDVIEEEFTASGYRQVFTEEVSDLLTKIDRHQIDLLDELGALDDMSDLVWTIKDHEGKTFEDRVIDGRHVWDLYEDFYNLKHPFKKGDKVWDKGLQTWFYVTDIDKDGFGYFGYFFNDKDKRITEQSDYLNLRRSHDEW